MVFFEAFKLISGQAFLSTGGAINVDLPLSHLRSKGTASAYITYCTDSGMLTRYTHSKQCNIKKYG